MTTMMQPERVKALVAPYVKRRAAPDHSRRDVSLSWPGRGAMAARPHLSCGRCRAPDAAVLRAGHVPRDARRREPRLEICGGAARHGALRIARDLSSRTRAACACRDRGRDRGRPLYLRTRPCRRAQARRDLARRDGQTRARERERPDSADPCRSSSTENGEARPGTGARFIQPFVDFCGRRMLLDDATGGGLVLLASSAAVTAGLTDAQRAWFERVGGRIVRDR